MIIEHPVISFNIHSNYTQPVEPIHGCFLCELSDDVIAVTNNFSLIIDKSPIVEGHLMITSNIHIGCTGEIDPRLREEYSALKETAGKIVTTAYGEAAFYEHGRAGHCSTLADSTIKCDHFHLHILPINISINSELEKTFKKISLQKYSQIFEFFERYGSYLYFEDHRDHMNAYPAADSEVESHLLRTLICEKIGYPERSNWETHQNMDLVNKAIEKYIPVLKRFSA